MKTWKWKNHSVDGTTACLPQCLQIARTATKYNKIILLIVFLEAVFWNKSLPKNPLDIPNWWPKFVNLDWRLPLISESFAKKTQRTDSRFVHGKPLKANPLPPSRSRPTCKFKNISESFDEFRTTTKAKVRWRQKMQITTGNSLVSFAMNVFGRFLVQIFANSVQFFGWTEWIKC